MKTFEIYIDETDQNAVDLFKPFVTIKLETTRPDGSPDNEYDYINSLMYELVNAYNHKMKWTCEGYTSHFFPSDISRKTKPMKYMGMGE